MNMQASWMPGLHKVETYPPYSPDTPQPIIADNVHIGSIEGMSPDMVAAVMASIDSPAPTTTAQKVDYLMTAMELMQHQLATLQSTLTLAVQLLKGNNANGQ